MKIENQVCTQKQAEKLKELGILQQSIFRWSFDNEWEILQGEHENADDCSAFTTAELGVMIPAWHFTYPRSNGYTSYKNEDGGFAVADGTVNGQNYDTEAECRAALVIYILENNNMSTETDAE